MKRRCLNCRQETECSVCNGTGYWDDYRTDSEVYRDESPFKSHPGELMSSLSTEQLEGELRARKMTVVQDRINRRVAIKMEMAKIKVHVGQLKTELENIKITRAECPDHNTKPESFMSHCPICEDV